MEVSWFSMINDIEDVPIHTALEKVFNDVDDHMMKTLRVSRKTISGKTSPTNAGTASGHVKIDDTLKPRQALLWHYTFRH